MVRFALALVLLVLCAVYADAACGRRAARQERRAERWGNVVHVVPAGNAGAQFSPGCGCR